MNRLGERKSLEARNLIADLSMLNTCLNGGDVGCTHKLCELILRARVFIMTPPGSQKPWHGTPGGYSNHDCRCDACTRAWRGYSRNRAASSPAKRPT